MAAKLKDTVGKKYKISYTDHKGSIQTFHVIAGKTCVKKLEHSKITTGTVVAKTGDRFYAVFEFQQKTARKIYALQKDKVAKVLFPEAIEKLKVDDSTMKIAEDLYVLDPHDTATGKQWFLKSKGSFINNNTLG